MQAFYKGDENNAITWNEWAFCTFSIFFCLQKQKAQIAQATPCECYCMWYVSLVTMIASVHTNTRSYSFRVLEPIGWVVVPSSVAKRLHIVHELHIREIQGVTVFISVHKFLRTLNNVALLKSPACLPVVAPQRSFVAMTDNLAPVCVEWFFFVRRDRTSFSSRTGNNTGL